MCRCSDDCVFRSRHETRFGPSARRPVFAVCGTGSGCWPYYCGLAAVVGAVLPGYVAGCPLHGTRILSGSRSVRRSACAGEHEPMTRIERFAQALQDLEATGELDPFLAQFADTRSCCGRRPTPSRTGRPAPARSGRVTWRSSMRSRRRFRGSRRPGPSASWSGQAPGRPPLASRCITRACRCWCSTTTARSPASRPTTTPPRSPARSVSTHSAPVAQPPRVRLDATDGRSVPHQPRQHRLRVAHPGPDDSMSR